MRKITFKRCFCIYLVFLMLINTIFPTFASTEEIPTSVTVNFTVNGPTHRGVVVGEKFAEEINISLNQGQSVKDLIQKYTQQNNVPVTIQDGESSSYMSSLHNLTEKDFEGTSGWIYLVYDESKQKFEMPSIPIDSYRINENKKIRLEYTIENYLEGYQAEHKKSASMSKELIDKIDKTKMSGKIAAMLNRLDKEIPNEFVEVVRERVQQLSEQTSVEEYWDTILATLAIERNPYNAWGRDLIKEIGDRDILNSNSIEDIIYAIAIAKSAEFEMIDARWNVNSLQEKLSTMQNEDGSFGEGSIDEKIRLTAKVYNLADFRVTLNQTFNKMEDYLALNMHEAGGFPNTIEDGVLTAEVVFAMYNRSKDANSRISMRQTGVWTAAKKPTPFKSLIDFYMQDTKAFKKNLLSKEKDIEATEIGTLAIARADKYMNDPSFAGKSFFKFPKITKPSEEQNIDLEIDKIYEDIVQREKNKEDISEIHSYILNRMGEDLTIQQKNKVAEKININASGAFGALKSTFASSVNEETSKGNIQKTVEKLASLEPTKFASPTNAAYALVLSYGSKISFPQERDAYLKEKFLSYNGFQENGSVRKADAHVYYAAALSLIENNDIKQIYLKKLENLIKETNGADLEVKSSEIITALNLLDENFMAEKYRTKDGKNLLELLKESDKNLFQVFCAVASYKLKKSDGSNLFDYKLKESREEKINSVIKKFIDTVDMPKHILKKYDDRNISDFVNERKEQFRENIKLPRDKHDIFNFIANGDDIKNINNINILDKITVSEQRGKTKIFPALIIINAKNYKTNENHPENKNTLKSKILDIKEFKNDSTGKYLINDAGQALIALAPLYKAGDDDVVNKVNSFLQKASESMNNDGTIREFGNNMPLSLPYHSNDLASFVQGLIYLGIDPDKDERFIKNGKSLIDGLLSYEKETGFSMKKDTEVSNPYTISILETLIDYKLFKENKKLIYQYDEEQEQVREHTLTLNKNPSDAVEVIKELGKSEVITKKDNVYKLQNGEYEITVLKHGYKPFYQTFTMTDDESTHTLNITLEKREETLFVFNENTQTITGYKDRFVPTDLVIPQTINSIEVKHIAADAFKYSETPSFGKIERPLTSITLPEGLETIGKSAFQGNIFKTVTLPSSLRELNGGFRLCKNLKTVNFAETTNLRVIGDDSFYGSAIEEITIPNGVEIIGEMAFNDSPKLRVVNLPDSLKEIKHSAFSLTSIESITLPNSIEKLNINSRGKNGNNGLFYRVHQDETRANLRFVKLFDSSNVANVENTKAIVNPIKVVIKYLDQNGDVIQEKIQDEIVGINKTKITQFPSRYPKKDLQTQEGDNSYIYNYINPYRETEVYSNKEIFDIVSSNYFMKNSQWTFKAPEISGYEKPSDITKTLVNDVEEIEFRYTKQNTKYQLRIEGEGLESSVSEGEFLSNSNLKFTITTPKNKKFKNLFINDVAVETQEVGLRREYSMVANENINVRVEYDDKNYEKEIEIDLEKENLKIGEKTNLKLKYKGEEVALINSDIVLEYNPDILKVDKKTGEVIAVGSGTVVLSAKVKFSPDDKDEKSVSISSINVNIRIEDVNSTIIEPTQVEINSLLVKENVNYYEDINLEKVVAFLAVQKALQDRNVDTSDKTKFDFSDNGSWMKVINGNNPKTTFGEKASFMFAVNNILADKTVNSFEISDNDNLVVFTEQDYTNFDAYTFFENEEYEINTGEDLTVKLFKVPFDMNSATSGQREAYEGAIILKDNQEIEKDGQVIKTNINGEAVLTFDEEGTYILSAKKVVNGINIISRPYAKVRVKKAPKVSIESITTLDDIKVNIGTEKNNLNLPNSVEANLSNGSKVNLALRWENSNPVYDKNTAGEYIFTANYELPNNIVEKDPIIISLKVIVEAISDEELDNIYNWALQKLSKVADNQRRKEINSDWWMISELGKLGKEINVAEKEYIRNNAFQENGDLNLEASNLLKTILALRASGIDPEDYYGNNLIDAIVGVDAKRGIWDLAPMLWALSSDDWDTEVSGKVDSIISEIIQMQGADGLWGSDWGWQDSTGFALYALAPYKDRENVKNAIEKALEEISKRQLANGDFYSGEGNLNSLAMIAGGIWSIDADYLRDSRFIKNGKTMLHALREYDLESENGFVWKKNQDYLNYMATEQAFRALVTLYSMKENKGYVFNFRELEKNYVAGELTKIITKDISTSDISVEFGTQKKDIPFITEETLELSDGTTIKIYPKFNFSIPNYNPNIAGEYIFNGNYIVPQGIFGESPNLKVKVTVLPENNVEDIRVDRVNPIEDIIVEEGTSRNDINLPKKIELIMSNNDTADVDLLWNNGEPIYDKDAPGEYLFTADYTLPIGVSGEKVPVNVKVIVTSKVEEKPHIVSIEQLNNIKVSKGITKEQLLELLPKTTLIKDNKENNHSVNLSWSVENYNPEVLGDYNIVARFDLPDGVEQSDNILDLSVSIIVSLSEESGDEEQLVNKEELSRLVNENKNLLREEYPSDLFDLFSAKMQSAVEMLNNENSNQDEVNKLVIELEEAKNSLTKKSDILKDAVDFANEKISKKSNYISSDIKLLDEKLEEAKKLLSSDCNLEQINKIKDELYELANKLRVYSQSYPVSSDITVYFTLKSIKRGSNEVEMWIEKTAVTVPVNSRVIDVIDKLFGERGIEYINKGNYISTIKSPTDNEWFGEFDNGRLSGWMYNVNDLHTLLGVEQYVLKDKDDILWFYTNDYTKEKGSEQWGNAPFVNNESQSISNQTKATGKNIKEITSNLNEKFEDVKDDAWYKDAVYELKKIGLIEGIKGNLFAPNKNVTRAELITILSRLSKDNFKKSNSKINFTDVNDDDWYKDVVLWAIDNNIAKGYESKFRPNDALSREEMAKIISNYLSFDKTFNLKAKSDKVNFKDFDEISSFAKDSIKQLSEFGILIGNERNNFEPKSNLTRAEMATIIYRILSMAGKLEVQK